MFEKAPRDFQMNPKTEDLMGSGNGLRTGMVVLVEDMRFSVTSDRYDEANQWCLVQEITRPYSQNPDVVSFIAVYQDGHKCKRTYNQSYAWYYKLNADGEPLILEPEDFVHEPVTFPIEMTDIVPLVRVVATYDMMGDYDGPEWFAKVFGHHEEHGNVEDFAYLTTVDGPFGLQFVTFQVDVRLEGVDNDMKNIKELAENKLNELVGDSEIHIHVAQPIAFG